MLRASTFCKPYTACMANTYSSSVEVKINSKPHDLHNACESMTCCILNGINGAQEKMKFLIPAPTASHLQAITIAWHIGESCQ